MGTAERTTQAASRGNPGAGIRDNVTGWFRPGEKPILAFLQSQYYKDPERARRLFARYSGQRNDLIARYLFAGCLTGRRIRAAFGDDLCKLIVWEESSKEIGDHSASKFPPDIKHIADTIRQHKPLIIIAFGKLAQSGCDTAWETDLQFDRSEPGEYSVFNAPHPAARTNPMSELQRLAHDIEAELYRLTH